MNIATFKESKIAKWLTVPDGQETIWHKVFFATIVIAGGLAGAIFIGNSVQKMNQAKETGHVAQEAEAAPKTLYANNPDCVVDGKPGRDADVGLVLHQPEKFSAGCFRQPSPTADDLKNPLIGKEVLWGPIGQILKGTVVQYIGSSNEIVVKRNYDGELVRLGASGIEVVGPLHYVQDMRVLSVSPSNGRALRAIAEVTHKDGSKAKCTFEMNADLFDQQLRMASQSFECSPAK